MSERTRTTLRAHAHAADNGGSTMTRELWDRRSVLTGLGAAGVSALVSPTLEAALPEDRIKVIHYYSNSGDSQGRGGQPMVNQSTNVVIIETESRSEEHTSELQSREN